MNDISKYTSIAFRMLVIMLIGVVVGCGLDYLFPSEKPIFKLIFIPLTVILSILDIIFSVSKKKKQ